MEERNYADFSLAVHQGTQGQRVPLTGTIEVTRRCPLACAHCYNNLPMADRAARRGELTYEEHCRLLDEMTQAGCLWLLYTGGEIFVRKDFLDIYTHAKQNGLLVTLFTNGTLITPQIADYLAEWRPFSMEITLYGRTKETYERLTGIPGSYERCLRGIRLLMERGLPLKLKTVAVTLNKHELWAMQEFAEEELGLEFKFDAMINPRIDRSQSPLAVRLSAQEVVELDFQDPDRIREWRRFSSQFNGPVHTPDHQDEVYHCGGGINGFSIDPRGGMSICVLSQCDIYDWRQGNFQEGWEYFLGQVRAKTMTRPTKCTTCEIKAMCGMCPANGELENGDPEEPVDFLCQVAHLRAYGLDIGVPAHGECEYCEGGARYEEIRQTALSIQETSLKHVATPTVSVPLVTVRETHQAAAGGNCSNGGCAACSMAELHHA